uniref:Uncharacterized protein n=1 Tax=Oryza sativa subsp. japonica TaxID=39947 RepID=Q6ERA7_ORYSJ|nr:hypothetical protein [Oryza sativa Japonica Group]
MGPESPELPYGPMKFWAAHRVTNNARPAVGIVWVKLDRRCRVVEYSNTPCSRLMEMCLWVIPDYGHKLN